MALLQQFLLALSFFTRLPLPKSLNFSNMALAQAAWAFPLAGALTGAVAAAAYMLALAAGSSFTLAGWIALAVLVLVTGGLHEDGLADMADGAAHGRTREQKLSIMRDSRIGTYGVLALIVVLAVRANAMGGVADFNALWVFMAAGACSRAGMAAMMHLMHSARSEGLAADAGKPSANQVYVALGISLVFLWLAGASAGVALGGGAAFLACAAIGYAAQKQLGGITGDVLGAAQQVSEAAVLVALSIAFR